jgi:putative hydrolases of HD superfamily
MRSLWNEFEAQQTPTAQFAAALDRIQPFLLNQQNQGGTWRKYGITPDRVVEQMRSVEVGACLVVDGRGGDRSMCRGRVFGYLNA